ncbi:hypothetical protein TWF694_001498 [Orbilia ellipsospora]|uniref:Nephrocystin 3-like N-terminal domain-containing protein n=1 Tax=Orbilia ellipsospora TaxID=2528407 RepID=A0AAV9XSL4_9PEZI
MEAVGGIASIVALVEVTGKIGLLCGKYVKAVQGAEADVERIAKEAKSFGDLLRKTEEILKGPFGFKLEATEALKDTFSESKKALERLKTKLDEGVDGAATSTKLSFWKRKPKLRSKDLKWPFKKQEVENIVRELSSLQSKITSALSIDNTSMTANRNLNETFEKLIVAKGAMFGSAEDQFEPLCLSQTREEVLEDIKQWIQTSRNRHIFWARGMAGTGKSTIARTIAGYLKGERLLGASFFFKRSHDHRNNASRFFPTLAYSLAQHISSLVPHLSKAIEADYDICSRSFNEQFETLILKPLAQLSSSQAAPVVIVVDALDECQNEQEILVVVRMLGRLRELKSIDLRVFITSRPDIASLTSFQALINDNTQYHDLALHEVDREIVKKDIGLYLEHEFARIRKDRADRIPGDWPQNDIIKMLVDIAEPLFVSAATICRFVDDISFSPTKRLEAILKTGSKAAGIYPIYTTVFEQIAGTKRATADRKIIIEETRRIVSTVAMLESPLSRSSLSELIGIEEETIYYRLKPLHSILVVPSQLDHTIQTFHLSLRDFLLDSEQNTGLFSVDEKEVHGRIAADCLALMSRKLRANICDLQSPGTLTSEIDPEIVRQCIPPDLAYACRHWVYHLQKSQSAIHDDGPVHEFLLDHLLHWLEALSIQGIFSNIIHLVKALQKITSVSNEFGKLSEFLRDVERFVNFNQAMITEAALQVYFSGLIFAPKNSIVKIKFAEKYCKGIRMTLKGMEDWGPLMKTFEGHTRVVTSVAFSPDGKLASASYDGTIKLWDPTSGLLQTFEGHTVHVRSVAFSPDGKQLASASDDETIKLWDSTLGLLLQTFEGHTDAVTSAAFSPNGKQLASASYDRTIKLWDLTSGLLQTFEGHTDWVISVAFSPDGKQLASASDDRTIKLWDPTSGLLLKTFKGHTGAVTSAAFSPDGKQLASASDDRTIKLWDPTSGLLLKTFKGHTGAVTSAAFSPDGKQLASASDDRTIKLWDPTSGLLLKTFKGHTGIVTSVAFSPDGKQLASASYDRTIKLWDPTSGLLQTFEGHTDWVRSVAFSPDGKQLASASDDETIKLWDPTLGLLLQTFEGHTDYVRFVAFSPDGKQLASASDDETIKLWDVACETTLHTFDSKTLNFRFFRDGSALQTDQGLVYPFTSTPLSIVPVPEMFLYNIKDQWLIRNGEKFLWLPTLYRSDTGGSVGTHDRLVAYGCLSGSVVVLDIKDTPKLIDFL